MRWGALLLAWLLCAAVTQAQTTYTAADCPLDDAPDAMTCGYLTVPQNRAEPDSITVRVWTATLSAANPTQPPLLILEGGPGSAGLIFYREWLHSPLHAERDIWLIDQRGTGYSYPSLNCYEFNDFSLADDAILPACRDRLLRLDVDLDAYHSIAIAADIADWLRLRDVAQVDVYGVSYGSRLAFTLLRDHPQLVRRAVLDGVYPPQVNAYEEQALNGYRALQRLFAACADDAACSAAFPDLEARLIAAIPELNAEALRVVSDFGTYAVDGDRLISLAYNLLYDPAGIAVLPALLDAAISDDNTAYRIALEQYHEQTTSTLPTMDFSSEGMFTSVLCMEEAPFNTRDNTVIAPIPAALQAGLLRSAEWLYADCAVWDVRPQAPQATLPVTSQTPVLLLSGAYDPVTPPQWGEIAAQTLPNSTHIVFPQLSHRSVNVHSCPTQIAADFLNAQALDTACIAQMPPIAFYIPAD